jgi:hypothetical protein
MAEFPAEDTEDSIDGPSEVVPNAVLVRGPATTGETRPGPFAEAKLFGRKTPDVHAPVCTAPVDGAFTECRALAGLLLGYALLICGNGLFQILIPLRMVQTGNSTIVIGTVQSCF